MSPRHLSGPAATTVDACSSCGQAIPQEAPKDPGGLEVFHLLHTTMDYGPATAAYLTERYNDECKYVEFDPLPMRSVQSVAADLSRLRTEGLVTSIHGSDPVEWEITAPGRDAADLFVGSEA